MSASEEGYPLCQERLRSPPLTSHLSESSCLPPARFIRLRITGAGCDTDEVSLETPGIRCSTY